MKVGVLALQGAFREHIEVLDALGVYTERVRRPEQLDAIDALVMPGGESTAISKLMVMADMVGPLGDRLAAGLPVLATCAGLILLAREVLDGRDDQVRFGALDVTVRRNGYGTQRESHEAPLTVTGLDSPFPGVFIRAPRIETLGNAVSVLAEHGGDPVLVRQDAIVGATFHPELAHDVRIHQQFLGTVGS